MNKISNLPYFSLLSLKGFGISDEYLRIVFSRREKKGEITRLRNGLYATKYGLDNPNFPEFASTIMVTPSYLSVEYVLGEHGVVSENVASYTLVTTKKTATIENKIGRFLYHNIKDSLFLGFRVVDNTHYSFCKATKAKALFDYLYFRKNYLFNKDTVLELRLNLEGFTTKEKAEFNKYVLLEGSKKMSFIAEMLWKS